MFQVKGFPSCGGSGEVVKVMVTPKSGMESVLVCCFGRSSLLGGASGLEVWRVGRVSKVEDEIERFDGLFSRPVVAVAGAANPGFTGIDRSIEVVQEKVIKGWQVSDTLTRPLMDMWIGLILVLLLASSDDDNWYRNVILSRA